ncbi:MAG: MFS transporter [Acetobacteraceae bacterium]|nr:MFS transporter [Acetobacteraceae bacterium]
MSAERHQRPWAAIVAATALILPLGSVYAFSVFLRPIEQELHIPRSALSVVFGTATIGFVIGSVAAPYFFRRVSPALLTFICTLTASLGIAMAAIAHGLPMLLAGYGIVFGTGAGAGFIVLQQGANLLVRSQKGLLNGYFIALYPAGAVISAPLFNWCNETFGYRTTLAGLSVTLLTTGLIAVALTLYAGTRLTPAYGAGPRPAPSRLGATFLRLCLVFFLAAAAGLTVLSQAKEIIVAYGGDAATAVATTTAIAAAIACARLSGGFFVDRFPIPFVAAGAHSLAFCGAAVLSLWPRPETAAIALGMIGVGYGFVSGTTAGGIAHYWPASEYGRISARTYIAWCCAALSLPVLAGRLFDLTGTYTTTILIAGCGNLLGIIVALGLPRARRAPSAG